MCQSLREYACSNRSGSAVCPAPRFDPARTVKPASTRLNLSSLEAAREHVAHARGVAVLTGAGISAESGIPTFRDATTGLWARFDPMQLASEDGFRADPPLVWR